MAKLRDALIGLKGTQVNRKVVTFETERKKLKLKKNKYNDNYNELASVRLFEDISRYWNYLFSINWSVMDPDFNRDSICKLTSLQGGVKSQLYLVLLGQHVFPQRAAYVQHHGRPHEAHKSNALGRGSQTYWELCSLWPGVEEVEDQSSQIRRRVA